MSNKKGAGGQVIPAMPEPGSGQYVKPEGTLLVYNNVQEEQHGGENEFVEVEEEPNYEPQEEWEKDIPPFLRKLSTMVNENRDAFIWKADGSLIVKDPDHLTSHLLPTYFQAIKTCSFVRQLNMYGFHKIDDPTGQNPKHYEFRHPLFVPGHRELLKKIERRKTAKRSTKADEDSRGKGKASSPADVPAPATQNSATTQNAQNAQNLANQSILEAVTKLQKQTQDNQQALLQVLGELKSYRQSHAELERKLNQYVSQPQVPIQGQIAMPGQPQQQGYAAVPRRPIATVPRTANRGVNPANSAMPIPNGHQPGMNGANGPQVNRAAAAHPLPVAPKPVMQNPGYYQPVTGIALYSSAPDPYAHAHAQTYPDESATLYSSNEYANPSDNSYLPVDHHASNYSVYVTNQQLTPGSVYSPANSDGSPVPITPSADTLSPAEYYPPTDLASSAGSPHSIHSNPAQYYDNTGTYGEPTPSEQIDEFVLLNLGLEENNLSGYINSGFGTDHATHQTNSVADSHGNATYTYDPTTTASSS